MLNFGGFLNTNFWHSYRCQSSASIEDLLSNTDCTVDKLLDDDDCLQEFKTYNDKLIKYFDHDKLKILIDYITIMPDKDAGHNRGHKYPFLSGEIFNCEINQILDKFFEAPQKPAQILAQVPDGQAEDDEDKDEGTDKDSDGKKEGKNDEDDIDDEETKAMAEEDTLEPEKKEEKEDEEEKAEKPKDQSNEQDPDTATPSDDAAKNLEVEAEKEEESKKENPQQDTKDEEAKASPEPEAKVEAEEAKTEAVPEAEKAETAAAKETNSQEGEAQKVSEVQENTQEPEAEEQAPKEEVTEKKEEPEEEATSEEKPETEAAPEIQNESTVASTLATEAPEVAGEDDDNKYVLMDRLFKFIFQKEELNPVLSGYFCKLVSLLNSRKQKQLIPYVYAPKSEIIDRLIDHVYQKSVSEILNKLLTQFDSDYEPEVQAQITAKQTVAVTRLIERLGPDFTEEDNLNASTILQDLVDRKEFSSLITKKENMEKIVNLATARVGESNKPSKMSSLFVLNLIIQNVIEVQKKKDQQQSLDKSENNDDDDDVNIGNKNSDDEGNEEADSASNNQFTAQTAILVELLCAKVPLLQEILDPENNQNAKITSSINDEEFVPLGQQKLITVEVVLKMLRMRKEAIYQALERSDVFKHILRLVEIFQWNNFLQLKVINICDEVLDHCPNEQFKLHFLNNSRIAHALVSMGKQASYTMKSERLIRNGFMGLVVKIANKLNLKCPSAEARDEASESSASAPTASSAAKPQQTDLVILDYLEAVGQEWTEFTEGELAKSNEKDNKTLGGSTRQTNDDDDDREDNSYEVQMEKIMARFTNFNQIICQNQPNDDDDDEDDDETQEDKDETFDEDDSDKAGGDADDKKSSHSTYEADVGVKLQKVEIKEEEPLSEEFIDNNYWKVDDQKTEEYDVDSLLAELDE